MLEALRADFHRIPDLLELGPPEQPRVFEEVPEPEELPEPEPEAEAPVANGELEPAAQLGLF
jgi:hypothetical protein